MFRNQTTNERRAPRVVALVATTLATLALVVAFAPLAVAQTPDPGPHGGHPPNLTDAQKTCLTQHGITPPTPGSAKPTSPPTAQQRQAFEAAAKVCGVQPPKGHRVELTAAQQTCLTQHGITPPTPGSAKPTSPPSAQQRATFEAAAKACGLPAPPQGPPNGS
jgi:hypothetical protein